MTKLNHNESIYTFMEIIRNSENIEAGLAKIAADHNLRSEEALDAAEKILTNVNAFDARYVEVQDDIASAMAPLFKAIEEKPLAERIAIMDRITFNLDAFCDDDLIAELERGVSVYTLYERAREVNPLGNDVAQELQLRDQLLKRVKKMELSPKAIRRMAKRLAKYEAFAPNAAITAKEHLQLKCAAAMYLYLEQEGETSPEEAAVWASSYVYMQKAANAVKLGQITESAAEAILTLAILTAMICFELFLLELGIHSFVAILASLFLAAGLFAAAADLPQKAAVRISPLLQSGIDKIHEGFESIASFMENRKEAEKASDEELEMMENDILHTDMNMDLGEDVYYF